MSLLLSCQTLSKSYSSRQLFRNISFGLSERERVGLIGPNGAGKSTLLKILAGVELPDTGAVSLRRGARLGYVPQRDELPPDRTVEQALLAALSDRALEGYEKATQVDIILRKVGFPQRDQLTGALSGGWLKRLAIAVELIREPDVLLLDEPTNHLDLEGILWLETLLASIPFACLVVSHDRYFLERVTTRVVELNRAYPEGYFNASGSYRDFLVKREEFLHAQAHQEQALAGRVRREIEWLRRGPQGRATKAQARIQEAGRLIDELSDLKIRNAHGRTVGIDFSATGRRTKELLSARNLEKNLGGRRLFGKLSFTLSPGARLGILGPNGSGKTTLLRVLSGELPPDAGSVRHPDGLQIVLFDQKREQLDPDASLWSALAGERDIVEYRGKPVHVSSWAKRFLFDTAQLSVPVSQLSGGEQARILIARLMLRPADILILDEPTNDLDIPSLEVLEESMVDFPGALLLVTHDRFMLDRISTELLSLDGKGGTRFFAEYAQWEAAQQSIPAKPGKTGDQGAGKTSPGSGSPAAGAALLSGPSRALSARERREIEGMEAKIVAAEADLEARMAALADPALSGDRETLHRLSEELHVAQQTIEKLYVRWEELEARRDQ